MSYSNYFESILRKRSLLSLVLFIFCIIFSIILFIKYLFKKYSRDTRLIEFSKTLPGPSAYPIIGNAFVAISALKGGFEPILSKYLSTYGPVTRLWLGKDLAVLLSDEKDVEALLMKSNCLGKLKLDNHFKVLFGNSLILSSPVAVWKHKRREFQPFFGKNKFSACIPRANEIIFEFIMNEMITMADGRIIDIADYLDDLTMKLLMESFFNYKMSKTEMRYLNLGPSIAKAFERLFINWILRSRLMDQLVNVVYPFDSLKTKKIINNFIDKITSSDEWSRKAANERIEANATTNSENSTESFTDMLRRLKNELKEDDLVYSEIMVLILAGSETIRVTLANCLLCLAACQEIQEKLYAEINQLFGTDPRPAEESDFKNLPYLDQVIRETLRLFAIIPAIPRQIENDTQIGAHLYPKDTILIVNIAGIHHNPKLYPEPYKFNPDNFTPEAVSKRHRHSSIPFSAGPRNCIGKEFAQLMMKLSLVALLRTFSFHTSIKLEDIKLKPGPVETISGGYPIRIKLRDEGARR